MSSLSSHSNVKSSRMDGAFLSSFNSETTNDSIPLSVPSTVQLSSNKDESSQSDPRPIPARNLAQLASGLDSVKNGNYIIWSEDSMLSFNLWWHKTPYYHEKVLKQKQYDPRWASSNRTSDCWKHFTQVAERTSGMPFVLCQICNTLLSHPNPKDIGTSTMNNHLKSKTCRKNLKPGQKSQTELNVRTHSSSVT